ncbi:DUF4040 family protein [Corynebacterium sp. 4HC-13]|uniref:DUF4040 family protein n=1 Tax=Corynebacterium anserum TaxID=2684406 RepID=UPI001639A9CA|nr:DUF4040 family protein [Corynebacterium anserum]MBC2682405.1 DUF4040 family protein [Corynebacterium anserum]
MVLFAVPAIVAVALILVPALVKALDRNAGWPLAITFLVLAGYVIAHADPILHGATETWSVTWIKGLIATPDGGSGSVEFAFRMDSLGLFFTLLALTIGAIVFIYSTRYLHRGNKIMSFYLLMTAFMLAVVLLVLADDVVMMFIGWEMVSLASFFLIARSGSGGEAGSVRTLILTFIGGLFLLAAIGIMVATTHTTRLSAIIAHPIWHEDPVRLAILATLVALAGFSKAAQIPFHFWLPEAMAADTPVSAFLHAAAVVKAGVYLLMRFSGLFQGVALWHYLLIIIGMATALMAAVFAMQKTDLKKLTAYSTVSQLGWIVATIGIGTPFALAAALVHTASHALFKSSLFMLAGVIDHQTGTRDIRRLGSIWRRMPFTFFSAVIAAASMAAVPPTFGFVSKEGMLEAFTEAPFAHAGTVVLLTVAGIGALATFLYSARYITGAFIDGPRDMSTVKEASPGLLIPAALPGVLSLPVVLVMSNVNHAVDSVVASTGVGLAQTHLKLWHGLGIPLYISVTVLVLGVVGIMMRRRISSILEGRRLGIATGAEFISKGSTMAVRWGRRAGTLANSQSPNRHVLWIFVLICSLAVAGFMAPGRLAGLASLEPRVTGIDRATDLVALALIALPVVGIISTRSRLASIILLGVVGVGVSWMMLTLGAPDVALTNLLVEFCVVVIMMLVLRHQPRLYLREGENRTKFATALAVVIGIITFFGVFFLMGRHDKPEIAKWYLENTPDLAGGNNVVAVILVEFRAFDTLGELTVLGMAGIVIAAIIRSIPRSPLPGYGPGSTSELFRAEGSTRFPDVHKVPELAPFYSKYLRSTHLNSIPGRMTLIPVLPFIGIVSLVTFWRGHQAPGGGFLAALVAAGGLFLWYVSQPKSRKIGTDEWGYRFVGAGIITALLTGAIGYVKGSFLAPIHGHFLGQHVTTSLVFDLGVYFAVVGLIIIVINQLGGRDRPGADPVHIHTAVPKLGETTQRQSPRAQKAPGTAAPTTQPPAKPKQEASWIVPQADSALASTDEPGLPHDLTDVTTAVTAADIHRAEREAAKRRTAKKKRRKVEPSPRSVRTAAEDAPETTATDTEGEKK